VGVEIGSGVSCGTVREGGATLITGGVFVDSGIEKMSSSLFSTEGLAGAIGEGEGKLSMMQPGKSGEVWESCRLMNLTWKDWMTLLEGQW